MSEYRITREWIDRYTGGELNAEERDFFRQRMSDDPLLRTEVSLDAQLEQFLEDRDLIGLMQKLQSVTRRASQERRPVIFLLVAASVICLVVMGTVAYFLKKQPVPVNAYNPPAVFRPAENRSGKIFYPDKAGQVRASGNTERETAGKVAGKQMIASSYRPMKELEMLVGSVTRTGLVRLVAPAARLSVKAGAQVRFSWVSEGTSLPVTILLLNNAGRQVRGTAPSGAACAVLRTKGLPGGVYYWKLMHGDEMVILGKLTIY